MLEENTNFNFIRVKHNGETVSIVQHTLEPTAYRDADKLIQEVSILPQLETIISYDGSLDSLIETLETIKNHISENAQC